MTTTHFTQYDPDTGRILAVGWTATSVFEEMQLQPDTHYLGVKSHMGADYVLDGQIVERPTLPGFGKTTIIADDTDMAMLVLPVPMDVTIDGVLYPAVEMLELTAAMPAAYKVSIRHFPYRDFDVEITANAPDPD